MPWTISKDFAFSASHQLERLPQGHKCGRLHGHNYTVRVTLASDTLDGAGFVLDYGELSTFGRFLDVELDHRHLNDVPPFDVVNPTAERLAEFLAGVLRHSLALVPAGATVAVAVSETPKTWSTWGPE